MEELKAWLQSKNYQEGIKLLEKYSKNKTETEFLSKNSNNPQKMHLSMMQNRIVNIIRILSQSGMKTEVKAAIEIQKPIAVKKIHYSEVEKQLEKRKELTNKLLSYKWEDLSQKEQEYFGNEQVFSGKKELLIANSKIESELKSLHASLQHAKTDKERKDIADKLVSLQSEKTQNWKVIDNFEITSINKEEKQDNTNEKFELLQKRNNLRSQRAKLKKKIENTEHPNYQEWLNNYNQVVKELEEIEKEL